MKAFLLAFSVQIVFSCNDKESKTNNSSVYQLQQKRDSIKPQWEKDSSDIAYQGKARIWMLHMFQSLKNTGYSDKKAWMYIDSVSPDKSEPWYSTVRNQADSIQKIDR